jgi:uncharacterized protein (DUF2141 family)
MSTVTVNSALDITYPAGGKVSLRNAIATANLASTPTTIVFDPTVFATAQTIILDGNPLEVSATKTVTINGPASGLTINANSLGQAFVVDYGASAALNNFSIVNGNAANQATSSAFGGAVDNHGTLTVTGATISNCTATGEGGGIWNDDRATLTLVNDTFSNDKASGSYDPFGTIQGGAIYTDNVTSITNCTIANNTANDGGGGIYAASGASILVVNDIIAGNSVLGTAPGPDVYGNYNSQGFNLIGKTDGSTGFNAADLTGTAAKPLSAKLGALASNGGPTQTLLPQTGSPAINAGDNSSVPKGITTDQRGLARIVGTAVDIGSVEVQPAPTVTVTAPAAQTANVGVSKSFSLGSFTATGTTAPYAVDVAWGDGTADTKFSLTAAGTVTAQAHTFAKAGTDTVTVTVTDAAGHSGKTTFTAAVAAATQSITGTVFNDANKDGKQETDEAGLAGVKVYIDTAKTGAFVTGDPTATTTSTGAFTFAGLASGTYRIREVLPAGYVQTAPTAGYFDVVLSGTGGSGYAFADTLATSSISGRVFGDTNADGKIDDNEVGLGLWQVYIDANNDGKLESTEQVVTTDINGNWSFAGLTAGTYTVRVVPVTGDTATKPTGGVLTVVVTAGQASTNNLFGERALA